MLAFSDLLRILFVYKAAFSNNVIALPQKTFWFQVITASWYSFFKFFLNACLFMSLYDQNNKKAE